MRSYVVGNHARPSLHLRNATGEEVMVDKTFVFRRCADGRLRLCVRKSALPYSPDN